MNLNWEKMGNLMPAIVQDSDTLQVLMVGYMNQEALATTVETKKVTFFSRSKNRLWQKGETSGNGLNLVSVIPDCDLDSLLILARPEGPTCHRNTESCFGEEKAPGVGFLSKLSKIIDDRFEKQPPESYTTKLIQQGLDRMAQKVGEEGVEVVIAAKNEAKEPLKAEAADLLFHLLVLLRARNIALSEVTDLLRSRHFSSLTFQGPDCLNSIRTTIPIDHP